MVPVSSSRGANVSAGVAFVPHQCVELILLYRPRPPGTPPHMTPPIGGQVKAKLDDTFSRRSVLLPQTVHLVFLIATATVKALKQEMTLGASTPPTDTNQSLSETRQKDAPVK